MQAIQRITALLALALFFALAQTAPASAQDGNDEAAIDDNVAQIRLQTSRYVKALVTADPDDDGIADFDASGDGVAELPLANIADLQILPGQPEFIDTIASTFELGLADGSTGTPASCQGMVLSFDSGGRLIDWAFSPTGGQMIDLFPQSATGAAAFTEQNPFVVTDHVLVVSDLGAMPQEATLSWQVSSAGVPLANATASANTEKPLHVERIDIADATSQAGLVQPIGLFPLDSHVDVDGSLLCRANGFVKFDQGSPLTTNLGLAAGGLTAAGALGLFFAARPARAWIKEEEA